MRSKRHSPPITLTVPERPLSLHNQLRIIQMDITLNGLLCIRIMLGWLCRLPFPTPGYSIRIRITLRTKGAMSVSVELFAPSMISETFHFYWTSCTNALSLLSVNKSLTL